MVPRPLDRSGVEAQGEAGGEHNLTRTPGGCQETSGGGVRPPLPLFAVVVRLCRPRPSVCIPAGRLPGPRADRTRHRWAR